MQVVPCARIDFEISHRGGVAGRLSICPYAAIFQPEGSENSQTVTDHFVPQHKLAGELTLLSLRPPGTEITKALVEAIGIGCEGLAGNGVARLQWVTGITLMSPRFAEKVLQRRGFDRANDEPADEETS